MLTQPVSQIKSVNALKILLDGKNKHLRALSVLKQPVNQWDAIIVGLVSKGHRPSSEGQKRLGT